MAGSKGAGLAIDAVKGARTAAAVGEVSEMANTGARLSTNGVKLAKQLASEAQMAETGITMAGPGKVKDAARLVNQYGGTFMDWTKKSSSSFSKGGVNFETHWYENITNGSRVEYKTKFP